MTMNKKTKIMLWAMAAMAFIAIAYLIYRQVKLQNSYGETVTPEGLDRAIGDGPSPVIDFSTDADVQQVINAAQNGSIVHNEDVDDPDLSGIGTGDLENELNGQDIIF